MSVDWYERRKAHYQGAALARWNERIAAGLCGACGARSLSTETRCAVCAKEHRLAENDRRQARRAASCRGVVPNQKGPCVRTPEYHVTFGDGDEVLMCRICADHTEATAESYGTTVQVIKVEEEAP